MVADRRMYVDKDKELGFKIHRNSKKKDKGNFRDKDLDSITVWYDSKKEGNKEKDNFKDKDKRDKKDYNANGKERENFKDKGKDNFKDKDKFRDKDKGRDRDKDKDSMHYNLT